MCSVCSACIIVDLPYQMLILKLLLSRCMYMNACMMIFIIIITSNRVPAVVSCNHCNHRLIMDLQKYSRTRCSQVYHIRVCNSDQIMALAKDGLSSRSRLVPVVKQVQQCKHTTISQLQLDSVYTIVVSLRETATIVITVGWPSGLASGLVCTHSTSCPTPCTSLRLHLTIFTTSLLLFLISSFAEYIFCQLCIGHHMEVTHS